MWRRVRLGAARLPVVGLSLSVACEICRHRAQATAEDAQTHRRAPAHAWLGKEVHERQGHTSTLAASRRCAATGGNIRCPWCVQKYPGRYGEVSKLPYPPAVFRAGCRGRQSGVVLGRLVMCRRVLLAFELDNAVLYCGLEEGPAAVTIAAGGPYHAWPQVAPRAPRSRPLRFLRLSSRSQRRSARLQAHFFLTAVP